MHWNFATPADIILTKVVATTTIVTFGSSQERVVKCNEIKLIVHLVMQVNDTKEIDSNVQADANPL